MSNKFKRIATATILREGWGMDNEAWVEEDKRGNRKFYTTSHGSKYEISKQELESTIKETKKSLEELEYIRSLMED